MSVEEVRRPTSFVERAVVRAGFDQADGTGWVVTQKAGQRTARSSSTDHKDVEVAPAPVHLAGIVRAACEPEAEALGLDY
jgi:hypothetical protein